MRQNEAALGTAERVQNLVQRGQHSRHDDQERDEQEDDAEDESQRTQAEQELVAAARLFDTFSTTAHRPKECSLDQNWICSTEEIPPAE